SSPGSAATRRTSFSFSTSTAAGPRDSAAKMNVCASASRISARQPKRTRARSNSSAPPVRPGLRTTVWPSRSEPARSDAYVWCVNPGATISTRSAPSTASGSDSTIRVIRPKPVISPLSSTPLRSRTGASSEAKKLKSVRSKPIRARSPASARPPCPAPRRAILTRPAATPFSAPALTAPSSRILPERVEVLDGPRAEPAHLGGVVRELRRLQAERAETALELRRDRVQGTLEVRDPIRGRKLRAGAADELELGQVAAGLRHGRAQPLQVVGRRLSERVEAMAVPDEPAQQPRVQRLAAEPEPRAVGTERLRLRVDVLEAVVGGPRSSPASRARAPARPRGARRAARRGGRTARRARRTRHGASSRSAARPGGLPRAGRASRAPSRARSGAAAAR